MSQVTLEQVQRNAAAIGLRIPQILLPASSLDLAKFAVIACDQYTSEPDYWEKVESSVGESVSTLHLTFPEIYLEEPGKDARIKEIISSMHKYVDCGDLVIQPPGIISVHRTLPLSGGVRHGIVISLDLEVYDYRAGNQALCRATEKTIESRIPPRLEIRKDALIELPHVLILVDDRDNDIFRQLLDNDRKFQVYDFDLMMNSGHIKGDLVTDPEILSSVISGFTRLSNSGHMLFAVGDGNHSLATAKTHWENVKRKLSVAEAATHPARFALVEIQNLYDSALRFEPIHRILWQCDPEKLVRELLVHFKAEISYDEKAFNRIVDTYDQSIVGVHLHLADGVHKKGVVKFPSGNKALVLATLTDFLDSFMEQQPESKIDYVHGISVVEKIKKGSIGFVLPNIHKDDLFRIVEVDGILPRKTFSMGSADEKRFYLEAKLIQ